jgi:hypothetical protein
VDFEKTYKIVSLKNLWKTLEHYNISNSIIRAIKRLYENSFFQNENKETALFRILYNKRTMAGI